MKLRLPLVTYVSRKASPSTLKTKQSKLVARGKKENPVGGGGGRGEGGELPYKKYGAARCAFSRLKLLRSCFQNFWRAAPSILYRIPPPPTPPWEENMNLFFYHKFLLRWNVSERKYKSPVEVSFPVHRSIQCINRKYKVKAQSKWAWEFCVLFHKITPENILSMFSFGAMKLLCKLWKFW